MILNFNIILQFLYNLLSKVIVACMQHNDNVEQEPRIVLNADESHQQSSNDVHNKSWALTSNKMVNIETFAASWTLNPEQTLAFKIVAAQSNTFNAEPLKMYLAGPAGTGKSRVFNTLKAYFEAKNETCQFHVCSYMGVAAQNVGGMTLHATLCFGHSK